MPWALMDPSFRWGDERMSFGPSCVPRPASYTVALSTNEYAPKEPATLRVSALELPAK
jgi:hypothetical protein